VRALHPWHEIEMPRDGRLPTERLMATVAPFVNQSRLTNTHE
jgi:hypothetical protein